LRKRTKEVEEPAVVFSAVRDLHMGAAQGLLTPDT